MRRREGGVLSVFVRWPEPGSVLPRLIRRIGADAAAQLYEAILDDLVAGLPSRSFLYVRDHAADFRARFPGRIVRPQRGDTEGARLLACFQDLLEWHPKAVIVRGVFPNLHPGMVRAALDILDRRDAVVGPTGRGDFYLLGLRRPVDVFRSIRWGMERPLRPLLRNLEGARLDYGFFPARSEAETYEDLLALQRRLSGAAAPRTRAAFRALRIGRACREIAGEV